MLELACKFLISYFLGSIMGSMVMGRLRGGVDIRTMGSGNAGGTNALRTQGVLFALGVMIVDIGKGIVGAGVIPELDLPMVAQSTEISRQWLVICCAAGTVIGHVWPVWHEFRGGKGAATLLGTLIVLAPFILIPVVAVWILALVLSGFVGLATMLAGLAAPVYLAIVELPTRQPVFIYCALMALYLIYSHRSNVSRMLKGEENRLTRAMLFRRQRP